MAYSRIGRYEERKQRQRLILAIGGSLAVLAFLFLFGVKILISFSLFVDKLRGGGSQTTSSQQVLIQPPILDPLPIATNSSKINLTGKGQPGLTLIVYLNEAEAKKLTVTSDGLFSIGNLDLREGSNTLSAKLVDDKGNTSDLSNVISTTFKKTPPALDLNSPSDNSTVNGENNTVMVSGKTADEVNITVNDRLAVVNSDGSFNYSYKLSEGDNILRIVATDQAGNQTIIEKKITYHR